MTPPPQLFYHYYTRTGGKWSWTTDEKRALVEAAFARRADIAASLLYRWRRKFGDPAMHAGREDVPAFAALMIRRGRGARRGPQPNGPVPSYPALTMTARSVSVEMAHDIPPVLAAAVLAALVT